jgi:exonuclease SbcC
MTPERLKLNEFGPYTEPQTVDFDKLGARQLFLIHGATGAGKSTLLDAICFALYGETSGSERDGDEMRSDFATPDDPTEVTLDFRLGETRYRVRRRPQQELTKKRGEGTTEKSEQATLYDRSQAETREEDGAPIADGKRDVDGSVEDLLGLEHEQFRQVIVLPQGKFRKFLSAGSTEREEILKEMAKEAEEDVQRLRRRKEDELSRLEAEDVEGLEEKLRETESSLEDAKEEKETLAKQLDSAREALAQAKADREILSERDAAREAVETLRDERGAHETRKELLEDVQRAAEVAPVKDDLRTRREEKQVADEEAISAKKAFEEAQAVLETAEEGLEAEKQRDEEREALREKKTRLESEIDGLDSKAETIRDRLPVDVATREELEEALQEAESAVQEAREERAEKKQSALSKQNAAQQAAGRLGEAQERFDEALQENGFDDEAAFANARRDRDERESLKEEVESFEEEWAAATDRKARAEEAAEDVDEPDVEGATETVESLEEELDEVKETVTRLERDVEEIEEGLQAIDEIEDELQEADERYSQVGFLAKLARGDTESRMSLQRFVLATRLEEVLRVANEHIAHMTQNRYRLLRSEDVGDRRSGSGLDLLVHDAYTGERRPVATLSGGEGGGLVAGPGAKRRGTKHLRRAPPGDDFHRRGLWQPRSGGARSGDGRAMEALSDLRDTGRLVGIISHVSEWKQRVSTRLEVEQAQEGSSLSMMV